MKKPDLAKRDLWRNRLEEFARSSERVVDFCRRLRVPVWSFYYWQHRLRIPEVTKRQSRLGAKLCPPARTRRQPARRRRRLSFVPVRVTGMRSIEVYLANGTRVTVPCQERDAIAAVIAALASKPAEHRPC